MNNVRKVAAVLAAGVLVVVAWSVRAKPQETSSQPAPSANDQMISNYAQELLKQGKEIFRFDTFGDEAFWGDALRLHEAIAGEKLGGVNSLQRRGSSCLTKFAMVRNSKFVTSIPSSISLRDAPTQSVVGKVNLNEIIPARSFAALMQLIQICVPWLLRDMSSMRGISARTLGLRSRATETSISEIPRGSPPPLQGRDCRPVASGRSDDPWSVLDAWSANDSSLRTLQDALSGP